MISLWATPVESGVTYMLAGDWFQLASKGIARVGEIGIILLCLDVTKTMIAPKLVTNSNALKATSAITCFFWDPNECFIGASISMVARGGPVMSVGARVTGSG